MRYPMIVAAGAAAVLASFVTPSAAVPSRTTQFYSSQEILKWINDYRARPEPARLAAAVHKLSELGTLRDAESSGFYLGFVAGVLAANPAKADALVAGMLPLPAQDQWFIVRAIAYSGLPQWRTVMANAGPRVPARQAMMQKYLAGELPLLTQFQLEKPQPSWFDRVGAAMPFARQPAARVVALEPSADVLDTFWGSYYATGDSAPVQRIISLLPWSKDRDKTERLTLGGMAKFTLATNAARDPSLLILLKTLRAGQSKEVRPVLADVIEAADSVDLAPVRKEVLASLDEVKRKGPESETQSGVVGTGRRGRHQRRMPRRGRHRSRRVRRALRGRRRAVVRRAALHVGAGVRKGRSVAQTIRHGRTARSA